MTVFQDTDHFGSLWWQSFKTAITSAVFDGSAFLKRTLRGRFREKIFETTTQLLFTGFDTAWYSRQPEWTTINQSTNPQDPTR